MATGNIFTLATLPSPRPRVPELPVVEDPLQRRRLRLHEEIDFLFNGSNASFMVGKASINLVFYLGKALVERITAKKVVFENIGCPLPKTSALDRLYTIADGYYHI